MSRLPNLHVVVAGAGALGSCAALAIAEAGARVTLIDPAEGVGNASGVAAGMLAPAFESVLDPEAGLSFELLTAARDLWPTLGARLGEIGLRRNGAVWLDLPDCPPRAEALAAELKALGADVSYGLGHGHGETGFLISDDWRLDPGAALAALDRAFRAAGGVRVRGRVARFAPGWAELSDGARIAADMLVLATGAEADPLAPELADLVPIQGQILKYPAVTPPPDAPSLRCALGYATGGDDGLSVGASMQFGVRDRRVDPQITDRLHALAIRLFPDTARITPRVQTGVRAASPDGPPIIGASSQPGVWLAAAARRNGWLIAPLAAQIIAAELAGRDPGPYAARLRPRHNSVGGADASCAIVQD